MEEKAKDTGLESRRHLMMELMERWDPTRWFGEAREGLTIPVEEFTEDGHMVIRAELPGIDPDKDVSITLQDGMITITAERREIHEEDKPDRYRSEIRYGSFTRSIPLQGDVDTELVSASYTDGVLTVRLPVTETATEPRSIPVTRA